MTFKAVNEQLLKRSLGFCEQLLPGGDMRGNEYVCADLSGGQGRSFSVNLTTGIWKDFSTEESGGDLISLWAAVEEVPQSAAREECKLWLGEAPVQKTKEAEPLWWRWEKADKIWDYVNADGVVVCQVKRWNERPDENHAKVIRPWNPAKGVYEWPKSENRPLLNLPGIQASPLATIVIAGGEKCADAISEANWLGTTVMGGESAISKTDFTPLLERKVILWPDNDPAGQEWQTKLTAALRDAGAVSVQSVEVPADKPLKWDAADASPDELNTLLYEAELSRPLVRGLATFLLGDITVGEPPEREWIVRGSILQAKPSVVFGAGGCGKSMALLDLAIKVASRDQYGLTDPETFLGSIPAEAYGPTIFLTLEDDTAELHRRSHDLDPSFMRAKAPCYVIPGLDLEGFDPTLIKQEGRLAVLTRLAEHGIPEQIKQVEKKAGMAPKLLVLDPAGDFVSGSEDDAALIKPFMFYLRELASRLNIAIILIGHTSKGQTDDDNVMTKGMRGSSAWTANARFAFGLYRPPVKQAARLLKAVDEPLTERGLDRVVFGRTMKANFPNALSGLRRYMMDPKSGLLIDKTAEVQTGQVKETAMVELLFQGIKRSAELGMPFCRTGRYGLRQNREQLPGELRNETEAWPGNWLEQAATTLLNDDRIVKRDKWNGRFSVLDVRGGPVHRNDPEVTARSVWPCDAYDTPAV